MWYMYIHTYIHVHVYIYIHTCTTLSLTISWMDGRDRFFKSESTLTISCCAIGFREISLRDFDWYLWVRHTDRTSKHTRTLHFRWRSFQPKWNIPLPSLISVVLLRHVSFNHRSSNFATRCLRGLWFWTRYIHIYTYIYIIYHTCMYD